MGEKRMVTLLISLVLFAATLGCLVATWLSAKSLEKRLNVVRKLLVDERQYSCKQNALHRDKYSNLARENQDLRTQLDDAREQLKNVREIISE